MNLSHHLKNFSTFLEKAKPIDRDVFDLSFEEALSYVEQDQFDQAIPIIEKILLEGCLDIRLLMHLFYAHFLQEGIESLNATFPLTKELIETHWEKLSPITDRESHAQKSILWFLQSIGKRMKRSAEVYREKRPDLLWDKASSLTQNTIKDLQKLTQKLMDFFLDRWEMPSIQQHIQYILSWLSEKLSSFPKEKLSSSSPLAKISKVETQKMPDKAQKPPSNPPSFEVEDSLESLILASQNLKDFFVKLQLFETLIQEKDFLKGSIVYDDIKKTIEQFNPVHFFPKLFSRYYFLLAEHIDTFLSELENKDTPKWESLVQLYQTDLEAFIKW